MGKGARDVRRPTVPAESPALGLSHLQFEATLTAAKASSNDCDFALVAMLGLLGLRIFEATGSNIDDLGEEHGHRVLRVQGKGDKIGLVPLPPAVGRAIERAIASRTAGPILLTSKGTRMDRHCATRRSRRLSEQAGVSENNQPYEDDRLRGRNACAQPPIRGWSSSPAHISPGWW